MITLLHAKLFFFVRCAEHTYSIITVYIILREIDFLRLQFIIIFKHLHELFSSSTYASFLLSVHNIFSHSCSYTPPEPYKIGKPYNQKLDYSQVKSRVDTRRSSSPESSESSFGRLSHSRLRINAHHRSSSPLPGSVTNRKFKSRTRVDSGDLSSLSSKSERIHSSKSRSKIADYSHIESRINAGSRRITSPAVSLSAKSERLSLSADSAGLRSRIRSTAVAASGGQANFKVSSSPLPDYSHVKSRTDSGQRPRSKSASGSQQGSSSMSQNKVG